MRIALGQLESGADIRKKKVDATLPAVAESLDGPVCWELAAAV